MAEKDYKFFKENSGGTFDEKTVTAEADKVLGFDSNGDPEMVTAGGSSLDINSLTAKTTPVDADITVIEDSVASWAQKKLTWSNIKATLKTYFDTLYVALTGNQTVAGIKTFSSFPVTPSSAPTTDYQVANKKYVDDNAGGGASIDYVPASISWADASGDPAQTTMEQLTGISVPTTLIIKVSASSNVSVNFNNSNSWVGVISVLSLNSDFGYVSQLIVNPNTYIGFLGFANSSVEVYDNDNNLLDSFYLTFSGGSMP